MVILLPTGSYPYLPKGTTIPRGPDETTCNFTAIIRPHSSSLVFYKLEPEIEFGCVIKENRCFYILSIFLYFKLFCA